VMSKLAEPRQCGCTCSSDFANCFQQRVFANCCVGVLVSLYPTAPSVFLHPSARNLSSCKPLPSTRPWAHSGCSARFQKPRSALERSEASILRQLVSFQRLCRRRSAVATTGLKFNFGQTSKPACRNKDFLQSETTIYCSDRLCAIDRLEALEPPARCMCRSV
jgi:hypothetical protein